MCDAQRFLELSTPDSVEEIFSYAQPKKNPKLFKSVQVPTLVLLAGNDEHGDRPPEKIADWFEKSLKNKHKVVIVPKVGHSFRGQKDAVAREIARFMKEV